MSGFDSLPPWDAATWFQAVKRTRFTSVGNTAVKIMSADPMRVGFTVAVNAAQTAAIDIVDNSVALAGTPDGLGLTAQLPWVTFLFRDVGPVVQQDWFAASINNNVTVVVWEYLLRDWPQPRANRRRNRDGSSP